MSIFSGMITDEAKALYKDAIDELIASLGVSCRLIYRGARWEACPNCHVNPQNGQSLGIYKEGGPISFETGVCPYCKGQGRISEENTEIVKMGVIWDSKEFLGIKNVETPEQYVQILCGVELYPKLKRAAEIIIDVDVEKYSRNRFKKQGDPYYAGFGDSSYIFLLCKRI